MAMQTTNVIRTSAITMAVLRACSPIRAVLAIRNFCAKPEGQPTFSFDSVKLLFDNELLESIFMCRKNVRRVIVEIIINKAIQSPESTVNYFHAMG